MIKALMENGADRNARGGDGATPLELGLAQAERDLKQRIKTDPVDTLIDLMQAAQNPLGVEELHAAVERRSDDVGDVIEVVENSGADDVWTEPMEPGPGGVPLNDAMRLPAALYACAIKNVYAVAALAQRGRYSNQGNFERTMKICDKYQAVDCKAYLENYRKAEQSKLARKPPSRARRASPPAQGEVHQQPNNSVGGPGALAAGQKAVQPKRRSRKPSPPPTAKATSMEAGAPPPQNSAKKSRVERSMSPPAKGLTVSHQQQ